MAKGGFLGRQSMTFNLKGIIKNYSIIPVIMVTCSGGLFASYYLCRLAFRSPDVAWNRRKNPEPWQRYENKQYKFYSFIDHEKYKHPRPKYKDGNE